MKKMIGFAYFLIFLSVFSCTNKEVQLPVISRVGISGIQNHSSIWIFFEIKDQDTIAVLNKNNKLLNTHWIFNVDRRLTMQKVIPFLIEMQKSKNKESMHKKEGLLNYFSYANSKDQSISLIIFNNTTYIYSKTRSLKILDTDLSERIIEIDIKNDELFIDNSRIDKEEVLKKIEEIHSSDTLNKFKIVLKYSQNTTFQNYLSVKSYLLESSLTLDSNEYVYRQPL